MCENHLGRRVIGVLMASMIVALSVPSAHAQRFGFSGQGSPLRGWIQGRGDMIGDQGFKPPVNKIRPPVHPKLPPIFPPKITEPPCSIKPGLPSITFPIHPRPPIIFPGGPSPPPRLIPSVPTPPIVTAPAPVRWLPVTAPSIPALPKVWLPQPKTGPEAKLCAYYALYHFHDGDFMNRKKFIRTAAKYLAEKFPEVMDRKMAEEIVRDGSDPVVLEAFGLREMGDQGWSRGAVIVADAQAGHFYTVRQIDGSWWSLDSYNLPQPQRLGSVLDGPPYVSGQIWAAP